MKQPYKHRINNRQFLNLPGFHDSAYIVTYVEDTSEREPETSEYGGEEKYNVEPRIILEIADCSESINLEFELYNAHRRQNSFHKIDTLIEALTEFKEALRQESAIYKQRQVKLDAENKAKAAAKEKEAETKEASEDSDNKN